MCVAANSAARVTRSPARHHGGSAGVAPHNGAGRGPAARRDESRRDSYAAQAGRAVTQLDPETAGSTAARHIDTDRLGTARTYLLAAPPETSAERALYL